MTVEWSRYGLPLLARELTEIANRRRTYWLRIVYALLLYLLAFFQFYDILQSGSGRFAVLGHGSRMFETLFGIQFFGVYLFMPIVGCSAITHEKERNSLSLLLLTRLGPTTILLEKLLSRLVPMFVFLLLAMPLLAFTYTLGGVTEFRLWASIFVMSLTAVQVAALTLMCSAYCTTTIAAFVASYALSFASLFFCSCGGLFFATGPTALSVDSIGELAIRTFLLGASTVVFLLLARSWLISRAFVEQDAAVNHSLKRLNRFHVQTDASTGTVTLIRHTQPLPLNEPVAWRELAKSSTGFLLRLALTIEVPLLFVLIVGFGIGQNSGVFEVIEILLWIIAVLLIVVNATGVISHERDRQTMDVLMATPLSGRELLAQKLKPVWRLAILLWIPFGTLALFRMLLWGSGGFAASTGLRILISILSFLVFVPLIAWLSLWISLLVRSQGRAILLTLVLIGAWTMVAIAILPMESFSDMRGEERVWIVLSPATIFRVRLSGNMFDVVTVAIHAGVYSLWLMAVRRYVLTRADRLLGRLGDNEKQPLVKTETLPQSMGIGQETAAAK